MRIEVATFVLSISVVLVDLSLSWQAFRASIWHCRISLQLASDDP
jgi:hypothetical protein